MSPVESGALPGCDLREPFRHDLEDRIVFRKAQVLVQNGVREFQSLVDAVAVANGTFIGLGRMVAPLGDEVFVGEQFRMAFAQISGKSCREVRQLFLFYVSFHNG